MNFKQANEDYIKKDFKRITIVLGHYGSGKSEFSINYALKLSKIIRNVSLIDIDVASPYFRSRERADFLKKNGVTSIFSSFGVDNNLDMPALTPIMFAPIQDPRQNVVIDCGGDSSGAKILEQLKRYLPKKDQMDILCVINANRPETSTIEGALQQISSIENEIDMNIGSIVNNTHMLRETKLEDIIFGNEICKKICKTKEIRLKFTCIEESLLENLFNYNDENSIDSHLNESEQRFIRSLENIFPINLMLRENWLDL